MAGLRRGWPTELETAPYATNIRIFDHFLEKLPEFVNNWRVCRVNN